MTAAIYRDPPNRGCQFEEWKGGRQEMGTCGSSVYGRVGKTDLCKEHFKYACGVHRIGHQDIRREEAK
jgi:hypothetical protein